jgi:hypothetical protein
VVVVVLLYRAQPFREHRVALAYLAVVVAEARAPVAQVAHLAVAVVAEALVPLQAALVPQV